MSLLRELLPSVKENNPPGLYRFRCTRYVNGILQPIEVNYLDNFKELEIAVEEIKAQGPLLYCSAQKEDLEFIHEDMIPLLPCGWGKSSVNSIMGTE